MTSRSRKKHLTTVPTCLAEILCKAPSATSALLSRGGLGAAVLLASSGLPLSAQAPRTTSAWQPVPKFGETASPAAAPAVRPATNRPAAAWNLQWRKSGQTEPAAVPQHPAATEPLHHQSAPAQVTPAQVTPAQVTPAQVTPAQVAVSRSATEPVAALAPAPRVPIRKLSPQSAPLAAQPLVARTSYRQSRQASSVQPAAFQNPGDDSSLQLPPGLRPQTGGDENLDIFNDADDPFQDDAMQSPPNPLDNPRNNLPAPQTNPMRDPASPYDRGNLPAEPQQPGDMQPRDGSPAQDSDQYINPFQRPRTESPDTDRDSEPLPSPGDVIQPSRLQEFSCDTFRDRISARTIEKISLDISPPFRPDILAADDLEKERRKFEEKQEVRDWRSMDGYVMARGRLRDLVYEKVLVESEHGTTEEIPLNRISEADLAYISEQWGLPSECRIRQETYTPRNWTPSQVAWKASGLCHKPLYFEEVNLERYGHTAGPMAQPVLSTAHFFVNIAVLPYKMGIHPPNECQYTLGYYRPGSCAPWVVPPVPISLRGAIAEAAVVGGFVGLIP